VLTPKAGNVFGRFAKGSVGSGGGDSDLRRRVPGVGGPLRQPCPRPFSREVVRVPSRGVTVFPTCLSGEGGGSSSRGPDPTATIDPLALSIRSLCLTSVANAQGARCPTGWGVPRAIVFPHEAPSPAPWPRPAAAVGANASRSAARAVSVWPTHGTLLVSRLPECTPAVWYVLSLC